jgi:putative membrane protein
VRYLKALYLLIGVGLLAFVVTRADLDEVWSRVVLVGVWGITAIVAIYFVAFLIDSFTWQMALVRLPLNATWLYRTFKVRMVGEVFNNVMPMAGMGGEPVKAELLKRHYGINYREGTASIILGRTINMISQGAFLAIGFVIVWLSPLPASFKSVAGVGLVAFVAATAVFFGAQRLRLTSLTGTWLSRWRVARRLEDVLHHIRDLDERLVRFYTRHGGRLSGAVVLAFLNWVAGVFEVYVTMIFLGHPVTFADAWVIESVAQLVRAGAFFIPAAIGAQEGAFLVVCTVITGSPALGVAVSLVRRFREIIWLLWGALLGALYSMKPVAVNAPPAGETGSVERRES